MGALLNATGRQTINTTFMGITMGANIILNLMLIPRYGAVGASIAAVSTNAFLWLATMLYAFRILRPSMYILQVLVKTLVAVGLMALAVMELKAQIYWPITVGIGGIIYIAVHLLFRTLTRDDIHKLIALITKRA